MDFSSAVSLRFFDRFVPVLRRSFPALLLAYSCSCNLNAYGLVYCVPTSTTIVVVAIYGLIGGFRIVDDCRWEVKVRIELQRIKFERFRLKKSNYIDLNGVIETIWIAAIPRQLFLFSGQKLATTFCKYLVVGTLQCGVAITGADTIFLSWALPRQQHWVYLGIGEMAQLKLRHNLCNPFCMSYLISSWPDI